MSATVGTTYNTSKQNSLSYFDYLKTKNFEGSQDLLNLLTPLKVSNVAISGRLDANVINAKVFEFIEQLSARNAYINDMKCDALTALQSVTCNGNGTFKSLVAIDSISSQIVSGVNVNASQKMSCQSMVIDTSLQANAGSFTSSLQCGTSLTAGTALFKGDVTFNGTNIIASNTTSVKILQALLEVSNITASTKVTTNSLSTADLSCTGTSTINNLTLRSDTAKILNGSTTAATLASLNLVSGDLILNKTGGIVQADIVKALNATFTSGSIKNGLATFNGLTVTNADGITSAGKLKVTETSSDSIYTTGGIKSDGGGVFGTVGVVSTAVFNGVSHFFTDSNFYTPLLLSPVTVEPTVSSIRNQLYSKDQLIKIKTTGGRSFDLNPQTAKGDLVTYTGSNTIVQPIGANLSVLRANSSTSTGLAWAATSLLNIYKDGYIAFDPIALTLTGTTANGTCSFSLVKSDGSQIYTSASSYYFDARVVGSFRYSCYATNATATQVDILVQYPNGLGFTNAANGTSIRFFVIGY